MTSFSFFRQDWKNPEKIKLSFEYFWKYGLYEASNKEKS